MSPYCYPCERYFPHHRARNQHFMNSSAHRYDSFVECNVCIKNFFSQSECNRHMDKHDHHGHECENSSCGYIFSDWDSCVEHMDETGHWKYYCHQCERRFMNQNNLNMHLRSRAHRPDGVDCPFCKSNFATASGVSHHLETGSCHKATNLNRNTIHAAIRARDPNNTITIKALTWHSTEPEYEVSDRSYNYRTGQYECYLCPRGFQSVNALSQHLNRGTHRSNIYHCPNRQCGKQFVAMAALLNHLESESCQYTRFENVQRSVKGVFTSGRMLTFR